MSVMESVNVTQTASPPITAACETGHSGMLSCSWALCSPAGPRGSERTQWGSRWLVTCGHYLQ